MLSEICQNTFLCNFRESVLLFFHYVLSFLLTYTMQSSHICLLYQFSFALL